MRKFISDNLELMDEWHPKNLLDPSAVVLGSTVKCVWLCSKGHTYETQARSRAKMGSGCPYCSGKKVSEENSLKAISPQLTGEWHPVKNANLSAGDVTPNSNRKAWWICKNNHEWLANISSRTAGRGCPQCAGRKSTKENNLAKLYPGLALQWHPIKNIGISPDELLPRSQKSVWWLCADGHEWQSVVANRTRARSTGRM
ncbi:MAG: zinc-ribbon domain-containing protein [Pseudomonadales bacterium]